ncbi:hypothetical protein CRM22_007059 [Opisthorchis felineus]|uniref:Uncharacterized protein n=1 Tax=Opisthorchis felineus TaxID=147828 RepID=A0A4S2LPL7_OPIFE|nr:hypothetical protein CRM22_007059 [Opisthorchis felineus]
MISTCPTVRKKRRDAPPTFDPEVDPGDASQTLTTFTIVRPHSVGASYFPNHHFQPYRLHPPEYPPRRLLPQADHPPPTSAHKPLLVTLRHLLKAWWDPLLFVSRDNISLLGTINENSKGTVCTARTSIPNRCIKLRIRADQTLLSNAVRTRSVQPHPVVFTPIRRQDTAGSRAPRFEKRRCWAQKIKRTKIFPPSGISSIMNNPCVRIYSRWNAASISQMLQPLSLTEFLNYTLSHIIKLRIRSPKEKHFLLIYQLKTNCDIRRVASTL